MEHWKTQAGVPKVGNGALTDWILEDETGNGSPELENGARGLGIICANCQYPDEDPAARYTRPGCTPGLPGKPGEDAVQIY